MSLLTNSDSFPRMRRAGSRCVRRRLLFCGAAWKKSEKGAVSKQQSFFETAPFDSGYLFTRRLHGTVDLRGAFPNAKGRHLAASCVCLIFTRKMPYPNRSPAQRVRFGKEEQRNEREMTFGAEHKKSPQAICSLRRRGGEWRTRTVDLPRVRRTL